MQTIIKRVVYQNSMIKQCKNYFGNVWGPFYERPLVDRVVSTSTWPVPYYQRLYKAYPVRDKEDKLSLLQSDFQIDDSNWYQAKQVLRKSFNGRQVVNYIENELETSSYILVQKDVLKMAKAYVSDLCQFIDVANKENVRILNKLDLI